MKVLARQFSQIDTWQCSNLMKCTLIWIPELKEINKLLSQMDILHQKLIKFWSRETMICENVLQSGSPTPLGVKFWGQKWDLTLQDIGKRFQQHRPHIAGTSLCGVKMKFYKKSSILAGLLDMFQGGRIYLQQQLLCIKKQLCSTTTTATTTTTTTTNYKQCVSVSG